jgi:hypothetical protein
MRPPQLTLPKRYRQTPRPHQVVGGAETVKPIHFAHPAMAQFGQECNVFKPAEAFFDTLSLLLAQSITGVLGDSTVDRASACICSINRHSLRIE